MRYAMAAVVWLLLVATAAAQQLNTLNVPSEVEVGSKIVATCNCVVPEGGRLDMLWNTPGLETVQAGNQLYIWGKPGTYSIDVVVVPLKTLVIADQEITTIAGQILRLDARFTITGKVDPEPDPDPDPEPEPDPQDAPFPSDGFAVMIVYEASETGLLPQEQRAILTSSEVIRFCRDRTIDVAPGDPFFRIWDDDYTEPQLARAPPALATAYREVKRQAESLPWIAISTGTAGVSQPLPADPVATLELLKEWADK